MRKIFGLLLALALVAAACGGSDGGGPDPEADPQGALKAALERLGDYEGVTLGFTLATDVDSLVALSEGDLGEDEAQKIIDSSIFITTKQSDDPDDQQSEIVANIAGTENALELKGIGDVLYVRADVRALAGTFGADTSEIDQLAAEAGSQPGFEFLGPAIEGEWLALTGAQQAFEQFGGGAAQEPDAETQEAVKRFTDALAAAAEVTEGDKDGPGTNLVATVNIRDLFEEFTALVSDLSQFPTGGALPSSNEVPDEDIEVDVWIDGGNITQIEFDVKQLADLGDEPMPDGVDNFAFRLSVEEFTGNVEAPDGATEVDFATIFQNFFGGLAGELGGDLGGGTDAGDICTELAIQLEGQPQEVIDQIAEQFAAECPNLADQVSG